MHEPFIFIAIQQLILKWRMSDTITQLQAAEA